MGNQDLVKIMREMAVLHEIAGETFKTRAYERVAYSLEGLDKDLGEIYKEGGVKALEEIPGVGRGIAEKIEEYLKQGKIKEYEQLKKHLPVDISGLLGIEGLGPKTIKKLYEKLKIKNLADLQKAAEQGKIRNLPGMGEKSEQKILSGIGFAQKSGGRFLLGAVLPLTRRLVERLRNLPEVKKAEYAGSIRRMQETVGDLDILVISTKPGKVMDWFVSQPEVEEVLVKGETKSSVRLRGGMDADLRVVPPESFGAAMQYFIGDKYHNITVREIAVKKGYKLNEYGLFKGKKILANEDEKEIYKLLGTDWIPPELRTNHGEIEAAQEHRLPHLIDYGELKGDLQVQTDWTDGANSIKEMAEAAKKEGLEYICITDHTKSLAMTGGLDEVKIKKQWVEIDKAEKEVGIKILKGAEVNILKDGSLDINDETLVQLDVVGTSVHSHFAMSEKEMTARIIKAMENPNVDIIFHPTGRLIQKRSAYQVDIAELIKAAKKTKTVLEVNAYPERLDLSDEHIRQAVEAGVKISIDSDAHSVSHFKYLELGVAQARRGWAEKKDVINAHGWQEMLKMLK